MHFDKIHDWNFSEYKKIKMRRSPKSTVKPLLTNFIMKQDPQETHCLNQSLTEFQFQLYKPSWQMRNRLRHVWHVDDNEGYRNNILRNSERLFW